MKIRLRQTILFFVSSLFLTTCGTNASDADRLFVADLIPHHILGVKLINEASIRSSDVRLKKLVFDMSSYHHRELHDLETWATDWKIVLNRTFPGSLTSQELDDLRALSDLDYDVKWLKLMIKHHEGAIEIANRLLAESSNPRTTSMALRVKKTQSIEIHSMRELLWALCDFVDSPTVSAD